MILCSMPVDPKRVIPFNSALYSYLVHKMDPKYRRDYLPVDVHYRAICNNDNGGDLSTGSS